MRKISLTEKIILNYLLLGLVSIIIIASYSFYTAKNALMERTFEQLTSVRTYKKNQIEQFFKDRCRDIQLLSVSNDVKYISNIFENSNIKVNILINDEFDYLKFVTQFLDSTFYFKKLIIIKNQSLVLNISLSNNNKTIINVDDLKNYPLTELINEINDNKKTVILQDFIKNKYTLKNEMYLGCKIPDKNSNSGIIIAEISYEAINNIMFENNPHNGLGKSGESYLVGSDYFMRSNSRFYKNSLMEREVKTKSTLNAHSNKSGTQIIKDYRNIDVLSAYTPLNIINLNWSLLAEIDLNEATIPVYNLRNNTILISILISVIFFISAFLISRRITRPIIKLKEASIKICKGEFNSQLPIYSNDEIGSLTESFNAMSNHLEKQSIELQQERMLRMQSVIDGQEIERQRLSRELHDGLGQLLIAIKLKLEGLMFTDRSKLIYTVEGIKKMFDSTIDEVKRISYDLMPAVLFEFGLAKAISNLCDEIETRFKIKIRYTSELQHENFNKIQKTYLFRIIQEALNNIAKHSEATLVDIQIKSDVKEIYLNIEDNGKGFNIEERLHLKNTNGIYNMRERTGLLNGNIDISSEINKGTKVTVKIPLD